MRSYWSVTLFTIQENPVNLTRILAFIIIILSSVLLGFLVKRAITKAFSMKKQFPRSSAYAFSRLIYFMVVIIGFYIAFMTLGIDLTGIAMIAGAISVGIGFGLQAILSNFVSGILILFEKSINLGDIIQLESGVIGIVEKINIRSTVIKTCDQKRTMVPNTEMISKKMTNWSLEKKGVYLVCIPFSVKRETDKTKIEEIILRLAKHYSLSSNGTYRPARLVKLSEEFQEWEIIFWRDQKSQEALSFTYLVSEIEELMNKQGITLERISCPSTIFS